MYFDTYNPCISNCWARQRGLHKIAYFNWGSTCRKVWEPLVYSMSLLRHIGTYCACTRHARLHPWLSSMLQVNVMQLQACNQLGTPCGEKSFLKGPNILILCTVYTRLLAASADKPQQKF